MKNYVLKIFIIAIVTLAIVGAIVGVLSFLILGGVFHPRIHAEQMEDIFVEDYELLVFVVQFFENSDHENVYFRREHIESGVMLTDGGDRIDIEDNYVLEIARQLIRRGYSAIGTRGNTVYFLRWAGRDRGSGIAFSMDGNEPTSESITFLTRLKPLSKSNWYYYESDFREWDRRRRVTIYRSPVQYRECPQ